MPEVDFYNQPLVPTRTKLMWIGLALAGLLIVGFGLVEGYRAARLWRAHMLVDQAELLVKDKTTAGQGVSNLMAADQMEPFDPKVVRAVAEYKFESDSPIAAKYFALLAALPGSNHVDKEAALRGLLGCGDLRAADQVANLLNSDNAVAEDFALQGQLFWLEKDPARAIGGFRHAITMAPDNRRYQLDCAQLLVQLTDADARMEGLETLRKLAQGKDIESLHALEVLSNDPDLDAASQQWTVDRLRQHPLANDTSHLRAWELERRMGKRPAEEIMQEAFSYFKRTDADRRAVGGRWLYAVGKAQLALDLSPLDDSLQNQDLYEVRIDSLATLKQWAEVNKELMSGSVPLPVAVTYLYRAEAARANGDSVSCAAFWEQAINSALTDAGVLGYLGDYAVKTEEWDEAKKVFSRIAHMPGLAGIGYERLLSAEYRQGTDQEILGTLHDMMKDFPGKAEPKNDWAYLSLILNENVPDAQLTALELVNADSVNADSDFLAFRTTLALSYLRVNEPRRAMGLYQDPSIDWPTASNSSRMIYAVVLLGNGDHAAAASMAKTVNRTALRPGERDFMKTYFP